MSLKLIKYEEALSRTQKQSYNRVPLPLSSAMRNILKLLPMVRRSRRAEEVEVELVVHLSQWCKDFVGAQRKSSLVTPASSRR
jgi:hypothetical protein